jgi:hypothetical protein
MSLLSNALSDAKRRRNLPRFRFSLRTLLSSVMLFASGSLLWVNWEAWQLRHSFDFGNAAAFSPDSSKILVSDHTAIVVELQTGTLLASIEGDTGGYLNVGLWSTDGRWLVLHNNFSGGNAGTDYWLLWDLHRGIKDPVAELDQRLKNFVVLPESEKSGYGKTILLPSSKDKIWGSPDVAGPIKTARNQNDREIGIYKDEVLIARVPIPGPVRENMYYVTKMSRDENWLVAHSLNARKAFVWQYRRPEKWWGVAWLPELWLSLIFAAAFVWSIWHDRQSAVP